MNENDPAETPTERQGLREDVRLAFGPRGLEQHLAWAEMVILVDVLSFSTTLEIAVSRGATVFPSDQNQAEVAALAATVRGVVGVTRGEPGYSLSPASVLEIPAGTRLVLPSVNGGALAVKAAAARRPLLAGCLRNATAVAAAARGTERRVLILAAGERRVNGAVRYCLEDWIGAGAIAGRMEANSGRALCPRSAAAARAFQREAGRLRDALAGSRSGRELCARGYSVDVDLAAELDASQTVPELSGKAFGAGPKGAAGGVRHRFFDGTRLKNVPAKQSDKELVWAEVLRLLPPSLEFPEAELNRLLKEIHPDFCTLRREMVDSGFLSRSGGVYRRTARSS